MAEWQVMGWDSEMFWPTCIQRFHAFLQRQGKSSHKTSTVLLSKKMDLQKDVLDSVKFQSRLKHYYWISYNSASILLRRKRISDHYLSSCALGERVEEDIRLPDSADCWAGTSVGGAEWHAETDSSKSTQAWQGELWLVDLYVYESVLWPKKISATLIS